MSKSSGFQKYSICWVFWHFVCVFVFVVVFVIVFVFVFVSSYDFWIAFIISFQNMYGYRGLWSLRAEIMVIFEVMTDTHTDTQTHSKSTYRLCPSGRMGRVKITRKTKDFLSWNVFKRLSWGRRCGLRLTSTWSTYLQQISFPPSGVHCIGVFFSQSRLTVFGIFKAKCYSPTPNMLTVLSQYSYVLTHWISPPFLLSLLAELTEEYLLPAIFCKISAFYSIVCIVASVSFFFVFGFCVFLTVQDNSIGDLVTH